MDTKRYPLPPFTLETAKQKVQMAENAWNTRDPEKVCFAYTVDTEWRNRTDFIKIAVRFEYEWYNDAGQWFRSYGNEMWEFDEDGHMKKRFASINDLPIKESDRKFK